MRVPTCAINFCDNIVMKKHCSANLARIYENIVTIRPYPMPLAVLSLASLAVRFLSLSPSRVCAPGEENWEQFAQGEPVRHTFPGAALSQHSTLQVSVTLLPRLKHIPATLLGQVTEKPSPSRVCHFPEELMQKTSEMCITARRIRTHRESLPSSSAATRDGFPFSPLQPSPMSPKLLSGLADKSPYSSLTDTARLKSCRGCSGSHQEHDCLQHFCFDRTCVEQSHSHKHGQVSPEKRTSERVPVVYRQTGSSSTTTDNNSLGSSSVRPPAASSPVRLDLLDVAVCTSRLTSSPVRLDLLDVAVCTSRLTSSPVRLDLLDVAVCTSRLTSSPVRLDLLDVAVGTSRLTSSPVRLDLLDVAVCTSRLTSSPVCLDLCLKVGNLPSWTLSPFAITF